MKFQLLIFLFSTFLPIDILPSGGDEVIGFWLTDDGKAKVEIYKDQGKYNGKIVWLREPLNESGMAKLDRKNPDKALQSRPIIGMNLIQGFEYDDGRWVSGEVYDPEDGKAYSCKLTLKRGKLEVRGFIGISMFGRTVVWTRTQP